MSGSGIHWGYEVALKMVLKPKALVGSIEAHVVMVTDKKFDEEFAIIKAFRVVSDGGLKIDTN